MYKQLFGLLVLAGLNGQVAARQVETDSLLQMAETARIDSVKLDALLDAIPFVMETQPDRGIRIGQQALALSEKTGDSLRKARSLQMLGICYDYKGNLDSCLFLLNTANALLQKLKQPAAQSNVISDIAIAYYVRGNYELALRNNLQALELRKAGGDKNAISKSLNNIGLLYKNRKDYTNAIRYYQESVLLKEDLQDEQGLVNTYMNIGSMFQSQKMYDSAYLYAKKCLSLAEKLQKEDDIAGAKTNIAEALISMNRMQEAALQLKEAQVYAMRSNCLNCLLTIYHGLGNIYVSRKEYSKALQSFHTGLQVVRPNNLARQTLTYYQDISDCYRQMGQYRLALQYQDSAHEVSTRMLNEENLRQINEMTAVYETTEKEKQIDKLNAEKILSAAEVERRKQERNYFIISSILFLALSVMAYLAYTSNKKKNALLNSQNRIIEQSLGEKEILLKEIHHRVKNNLQMVSSLLSLQTDYIKDERALDAVKESRNRVHSMALIHQNLYQEDNLTGINVDDYISKLCDNLFNSYNIRPGKIQLIKNIPPLQLDVEVVVPLGLMLNELITNSLKYAFTKTQEGIIKIRLAEKDDELQLSVYDNGKGLPAGFNLQDARSFGFKMIHAFVRKMKGGINIYTEDGTKVEIILRNYKPVGHAGS